MRYINISVVMFLFSFGKLSLFSQNIGINSTGVAPASSAMLDLNTGNTFTSPNGKGFLIPKIALTGTADVTTIASPATSLLVYNTTNGGGVTPGFYYYNSGSWIPFIFPTGSGGTWLLLGNAGTTDVTHFLGTTDNIPFNIKVNNVKSGRIDHLLYNTYFGYQSGLNSVSGTSNTAFGTNSLKVNTYASDNIAIGKDALLTQSYANGNSAWSTYNIAIGTEALKVNQPSSNTTGNNNIAIGYASLWQNTTGTANTAIGIVNQYRNATGGYNTSVGYGSNQECTGSSNVSFGFYSLYANTVAMSAAGNTAIGSQACYNTRTGSNVTSAGFYTCAGNTSGANKLALGYQAAFTSNASGGVNIGFESGYHNVTANLLFIDNLRRTNAADGLIKALIYGVFAATTAAQSITFNAHMLVREDLQFTTKTIDVTAGDAATINSPAGRFRKDASGSSFTLTNSFITANSIVLVTFASDPGATGYSPPVVTAAAGSATITFQTLDAAGAPTNANTDVNFVVIN